MSTYRLSAGVYSNEIDLSATVPAVATSVGAFAGVFNWGPIGQRILVDSESTLVNRFGKPSANNIETFYTAANFLAYSNQLYVVRTANTTGNASAVTNTVLSAVATNAVPSNTILLNATTKNRDDYDTKTFDSTVFYVAKYPGAIGNSLKISVCDSANAYYSSVNIVSNSSVNSTASVISFTPSTNTATITVVPSATGTNADALAIANNIVNSITVGDLIKAGNSTIGIQYLKVTAVSSPVQPNANAVVTVNLASNFTLADTYSSNTFDRTWEYYSAVDKTPGTSNYQLHFGNTVVKDELHIVVADEDGQFSGVPGTVLEIFPAVSRATDAVNDSGQSIYYKTVLNDTSKYVWSASDRSGAATGNSAVITNSTQVVPLTLSLAYGKNGISENDVPLSVVASGYDLFISKEDVDISIVLQGVAKGGVNGTGLANYIINNISETRQDCVLVLSPEKGDVVNAAGGELDNIIAFRNSISSSSYAIIDSGYKYQYDKYSDTYKWIPLNGDIGGIIARTDDIADAWYSPAGYNRGKVKNIVKLAYNPNQPARDQLQKADVNPVVSQPGQGTVLYGDKTALGRQSAFNRINVRRLFIVLRKAISLASQSLLFEFNDTFTRAQFVSMVEPYLRSVEGKRGIYDFRVVCNEDNNTSDIIDNNGFVGDIYVQPAKSITWINLNFVATRTGVQFEEIVGRF